MPQARPHRQFSACATSSEARTRIVVVPVQSIRSEPGEITIRPFRAGDEPQLLAGHNQIFPPRSLAHWQWKFRDNPTGQVHTMVADHERDGIVGAYVTLPSLYVVEGEQRLADLEQVNADAWPWAPWMYAARDTDMIVPESGGAPVYEGLRLARPRPGAPGQLDYFEFGQVVQTDEGENIGLRAAGSPGWQLIAYTGHLGGAPITAADFPRDGGPAWPEDDDARTAAAAFTSSAFSSSAAAIDARPTMKVTREE